MTAPAFWIRAVSTAVLSVFLARDVVTGNATMAAINGLAVGALAMTFVADRLVAKMIEAIK